MTRSWERLSGLSGALFVILFMVGFAISGDTGDTHAETRAYFEDEANRSKQAASYFLVVAASLAYLWFVATLSLLLARAAADGLLRRLTVVAGVASAALLLAAAALFSGTAAAFESDDEFRFDPSTHDVVESIGFLTFNASLICGALFVFALSLALLRTRTLPRWIAWAGLPVALVTLFSIAFFPVFVFLGWILAAGIALAVRPWPPERVGES